jgi:hypothetical protein
MLLEFLLQEFLQGLELLLLGLLFQDQRLLSQGLIQLLMYLVLQVMGLIHLLLLEQQMVVLYLQLVHN